MAQAVIGLAHGDSFALRDEDLNFMVMLAVSQGMKVAMEARTRQQTEFLWTTCLAMLGNWELLAESQEAVAALSVSGARK